MKFMSLLNESNTFKNYFLNYLGYFVYQEATLKMFAFS